MKKPAGFDAILTQNPHMVEILHYVRDIAPSGRPVLITGETGVGKELIAQAIHHHSALKGRFVAVNAAGLDDTVFSDTLFGHTRGAFTGAQQARRGLLDHAHDGTLFLDEIGDLSLALQVKLLRLLQEGEYRPLGGDIARKSNARFVAATNQDLWEAQRSGRFRKDLNFRLRTHHIHLPPLRERLDDLELLAPFIVAEAAEALKKQPPALPAELLPLLGTYFFPGNIRELQAILFDAVSRHKKGALPLDKIRLHIKQGSLLESCPVGEGASTEEHPPGTVLFPSELPSIRQATEQLIAEALQRAGGKQGPAAKMLGISQQALSKRLRG